MILAAFALSILVHEAGHAAAAQTLGYRWEVSWAPIRVRTEQSRLVATAGPFASFLLCYAAIVVRWQDLFFVSALCGLLSLPPFKPFDGYWIFR